MLKIETSSGFIYEIHEEALENYELVDAIGELEDNPLAISRVTNLLLGREQKMKMFDYLRNEEGIVPTQKVTDEIQEIFKHLGENKTKN